jgi:hypothetical protein
MGYTTTFEGSFKLNKPLTTSQIAYLKRFAGTRRMKRNADMTRKRPDPARLRVKLPVGVEGEYFVGEGGFAGQQESPDILEYNDPPCTQPGLWCKWEPTPDGKEIEWNGAEKFYDYIEWLEYIIDHFLKPWNRTLSGKVRWQGEDGSDRGVIKVTNNKVQAVEDDISNPFDNDSYARGRFPPILVRLAKSKSSSRTYEVRISRTDGQMYCTCKGWQMRKNCTHLKTTTKKHILDALKDAAAEGELGI